MENSSDVVSKLKSDKKKLIADFIKIKKNKSICVLLLTKTKQRNPRIESKVVKVGERKY